MSAGPTPLRTDVTIVPADDPARASWFLGARLSAQPIGGADELRSVVDQRLAGTQARVARAEAELARQLSTELAAHGVASDDELIEHADAVRLAVGLPDDAELRLGRLRQQVQDQRAATSQLAEAEAALAEAERQLRQLAPGASANADAGSLRAASRDIIAAEEAAIAAQSDLGKAVRAVRPEQRTELRVAGKRAYQADQRFSGAMRETKPLLLAAVALFAVGAAAAGAAVAGAVSVGAAGVLAGVLLVLALAALLQRRSILRPARKARIEAESNAESLGSGLRDQEDEFGDWGVRVMQSMSADDALRAALERWVALVGPDVDPRQVEPLLVSVSALDAARARRAEAADEQDRCTAEWATTAEALGIATEPPPDPGAALVLAEQAVARRAVAIEQLRELHEAERRLVARQRLANLLRGRRLDELEDEARLLTAEAADDADADRPLLFIEQDAVTSDERVRLLREARRLGPEGRFVVVTQHAADWNAANAAVRRALDEAGDDAGLEIDLREVDVAPEPPVADTRPWFAS
jgi:hypothetical protein